MSAIELNCIVKSHRMLTPTVFEVAFEIDHSLTFKAGQFISVVIPGAGPKGRDLRRAYSIASSPEMRPIELCIKLIEEGPGTGYLHHLKPGDRFRAFAPYGDFVFRPKAGGHACFIATGTGVAPFRAMVLSQEYRQAPPQTVLCLSGVRHEDELLYASDFQSLWNLKWVPAVSQPRTQWAGFQGRVTDYLRTLDSSFPWERTDFYLCGNGDMIKEVKGLLEARGVLKTSIHQEKYY